MNELASYHAISRDIDVDSARLFIDADLRDRDVWLDPGQPRAIFIVHSSAWMPQ